MKPDSLYNAGMKPLQYSEINAKNKSKFIVICQKLDGLGMAMTYVTTRIT